MNDQKQRVVRRSGYTSIPNAVMGDTRLSIEARGLLALLMTFKDGWVFRSSHLMKQCGVGRDKFYRMTGELKELGYITVAQTKSGDGTFDGAQWEINDAPCPEKPYTVKPDSGKSAHIRENNSIRENKDKPQTPDGDLSLFSEDDPGEVDRFDEFWAVYPKKAGKAAARKAWDKAIKDTNPSVIIDGAKRYARWLVSGGKGEFRPHAKFPQGWLSSGRWADEEIWKGVADPEKPDWGAVSESQRNLLEQRIVPPSMKLPDGSPNRMAAALMATLVRQ